MVRNCRDFWTKGHELGVEYERLYDVPLEGSEEDPRPDDELPNICRNVSVSLRRNLSKYPRVVECYDQERVKFMFFVQEQTNTKTCVVRGLVELPVQAENVPRNIHSFTFLHDRRRDFHFPKLNRVSLNLSQRLTVGTIDPANTPQLQSIDYRYHFQAIPAPPSRRVLNPDIVLLGSSYPSSDPASAVDLRLPLAYRQHVKPRSSVGSDSTEIHRIKIPFPPHVHT
ncbi:hypothetical protein C8R45DRAFT_493111 [Mycena sanguinolenta]|nr:hypothetical protein C8R45DRAFT_493111 [Mycena sanguinolenta]